MLHAELPLREWRRPHGLRVSPPGSAGHTLARRALLVVLGMAVGYLATFLAVLWWEGHHDDRRSVDAILVLGAAQWNGEPSPVLRARLDHAVELYQEGYAPRVVVTGGVGAGDQYSEAGVSARYLQERGVPPGGLVLEDRGHSSLESIQRAANLLSAQGLNRVLLVSDPPHMLRIIRMAEAVGLEAYGSAATDSPSVGSIRAQVTYLVRELVLYHGYQWLHFAPALAPRPLGPDLDRTA